MGANLGERDPCAFAPRVHATRQAGGARRSRDHGRLKPASAAPMREAPVCAESLLAKNGGDPVKAFQEGQILFNSSAIYAAGMAAHHGNTSAISSVSAGPTCTMSCCMPPPKGLILPALQGFCSYAPISPLPVSSTVILI